MPVHFGRDARLYYNSASYASPTWVAINAVRDISIPDGDRVSIDASGRDYGLTLSEPGHLNLSIEGKIRTNESDTVFAALETAALASPSDSAAILDVMILTGGSTTNGNRGFRFEIKIHKFFGEDQNIDQILYRSFTFKPCVPSDTANVQASVVVASGAPVFTTLSV